MKIIMCILMVLFVFISCSKHNQTKYNNLVNEEIVNNYIEINKNEEYIIIDWDKFIEIWLEENTDINIGTPYNAEGVILWDKYISDYEIASLGVMFNYYTIFDDYFSEDEKNNIIRNIKEEYAFFRGGNPEEEFRHRFIKYTIDNEYKEYITNTWKMIFFLLRINHYSNILNEYLSQEDQDRIQAKALMDFFKTQASWPPNYFYGEIGFPEFRITSSTRQALFGNTATYTISRGLERYSKIPDDSIIHYITESGVVNAIYINFLDNYDYFYNLGFRLWHQYIVIGKLKEDTYLFTNLSKNENYRSLIAVKLTEEGIEPYPAFNGNNVLFFPISSQINYFEPYFYTTPFNKITVFYNERSSSEPNFEGMYYIPIYDSLELIFNGTEFIGDYNFLNELMKIS